MPVFVCVISGRFVMVMLCVKMVPVSYVRMMSGSLVIARLMMLSSFLMMMLSVFAMLGCGSVVIGCRFLVGHFSFSLSRMPLQVAMLASGVWILYHVEAAS